jgi:tetratricopeptide (TPR) repeat protein
LTYPIGIASILAFRVLVPPLVLLIWPSAGTLGLAFEDTHWWVFMLIAIAADAGQSLGGSRSLARHTVAVLAGLGAAMVLVLVVFWRPIVAEYSYMRGIVLASRVGPDQEGGGGSEALTRAYRLCPHNEKYAHAYAHEVVLGRALHLMAQEEYSEALKVLEDMRQVFPRSPSSHQMLAAVHARQGNNGEAVRNHRRAIAASRQLTAEDYHAWATLGVSTSACEMRLLDSLGKLGGEESAQEILTFLEHEDSDVVVHAVKVLVEHRVTRALEPLRHLRESHPEEKVRQAAGRALSELEKGQDLHEGTTQ